MTLRVGLVGFGPAGRILHTPLIRAAGMEIVAVVTSQAATVKELLPAARVCADVESMLAVARPDLVVIASPNQFHVPHALLALQAGAHVVIDKPLAVSAAEARAVTAAAMAARRLLTCFHNRRWDSDYLTVKRLLDQNAMGEVLRYEARWDRYTPTVRDRWREQAHVGGGVLNDLGPHLIDQALCLFGRPDWLQADVYIERAGAVVDDAFEIRMGRGALRIVLSASCMALDPAPRFMLHGTAGSFTKRGLDVQEAQLKASMQPDDPEFGVEPMMQWGRMVHADGGNASQVPPERGNWQQFYRQLIDSILTGQPLPVEAGDAVTVLEIIEAARCSSAQGGRLQLHGDGQWRY
jgi:scyllo-inositol 2-dehydrogenase (NADP+)